jgi:hypothetical protein
MPFTLSHPAAAVPLLRLGLPLSATYAAVAGVSALGSSLAFYCIAWHLTKRDVPEKMR